MRSKVRRQMTRAAAARRHQAIELQARDSAAAIAQSSVPVIVADATVSDLKDMLCRERFSSLDVVLVVDSRGTYAGTVSLTDVLPAPGSLKVKSLLRPGWPIVHPSTNQEHAAETALESHVAALPVISDNGQPLGCIAPARLLEILGREHHEDMHRIVGMLRERAGVRHALEDAPWRRVAGRLPWLVAGLVMSSAAAALMAGFERTLQANITIAFFIPTLVYLADAIGTQTEAIAVRALSMRRRLPIGRVLLGEVLTGAIIGIVLGSLACLGVIAAYGDVRLGGAVGLSMAAAGSLASAIGLMLPWLLSRLGIDPAFGSGPVATIIQDVLTILIYFTVISALMPAG